MTPKAPRFFWVLIDEKKQLIEYVEFPKGITPVKAKPHRPRWAEKQTGKRVRLYLPFSLEYTFIKTFNTKAGRGAHRHWDESSVEVWVVTVASSVARATLDSSSYDRKVDVVIVDWLDGEPDLCWILNLASRSTWKLQVEASSQRVRYPIGDLKCWRMPNYEEDLMKYASKKTVDLP